MPTIDGAKAIAAMRARPVTIAGACLYYVWLAMRDAGATSAISYPTAYSAWQATKKRHKDRNPPAGVPVWWGRRLSDGNIDGDVVISLGGGRVLATDQPTWYQLGETTLDGRQQLVNRQYLGWSEDFLGNTVYTKPAPTSITPSTLEEDMIIRILGKAGVRRGGVYYVAGGKATFLGNDQGTTFPLLTDDNVIAELQKLIPTLR